MDHKVVRVQRVQLAIQDQRVQPAQQALKAFKEIQDRKDQLVLRAQQVPLDQRVPMVQLDQLVLQVLHQR
jgi:hypothetical protein